MSNQQSTVLSQQRWSFLWAGRRVLGGKLVALRRNVAGELSTPPRQPLLHSAKHNNIGHLKGFRSLPLAQLSRTANRESRE